MRIPSGEQFGNVMPETKTSRVQNQAAGVIGQATKNLGAAVGQVASIANQEVLRDNQNQLQQKLLQVDDWIAKEQNDPNTGLFSLQGENVAGATNGYLKRYDLFAAKLESELPDSMREQFKIQATARGIQYKRSGLAFENQQKQAVEKANFNAVITNSAERASMLYGDNEGFQIETGSAKQQIAITMKLQGHSDEEIKVAQDKYIETASKKAVENFIGSDYTGFMSLVGEPSATGGVTRSSKQARGDRNNNPGNIRISNNKWQGQSGDDGSFVTFATPEHGIRALGKNLLAYQNKHGLDTVSSIIARWAPSNENDTSAYINVVSKHLGVSPDDKIDLTNIDTLSKLTTAIIKHENGNVNYDQSQINVGLQSALGLTELSNPDKTTTTANGKIYATPSSRLTQTTAFNNLSPADQARYLKMAESLDNKGRSEFKAALEVRIKDANAAYYRGKDFPNPPVENDFIMAYGYHDGVRSYKAFTDTQLMGADISTVKELPLSSQEALLKSREPTPGDGYAEQVSKYESLAKATDYVNQMRKSDPIQYAIDSEITDNIDIMGDMRTLSNSIKSRSSQVSSISNNYGTPLTFFTKEEATQLSQLFSNAPVEQQVSVLDALYHNTNNDAVYKSALAQIGQTNPSIAIAGVLYDKSGKVNITNNLIFSDTYIDAKEASKLILEGQVARRGTKEIKGLPMPKDADMRIEFADYVGNSFMNDTQGYEMAYQAALDYYAGQSARKGDISSEYDSDRFKQAMRAVTGGVTNFNGQNILLPWGMEEEQFNNEISRAWKIAQPNSKYPINVYQLQSFGDSNYLVKNGSGYVVDNNGRPIELDIKRQSNRDIPE